jgi:hypothetical protein
MDHPTRSHPQNQKPTSDETSFFKTIVRVGRYFPDGVDKGAACGKKLGLMLMPWFPAHHQNLRGEPWTKTVLNDYAASTSVKNYNYWGPGFSQLSRAKQAEAAVAVAVLQRGQMLQEGQVGMLVNLLRDSPRIASGMPVGQQPPSLPDRLKKIGGWIQICQSGTGPGALTKVGFTAGDVDGRLKEYQVAGRVVWHYRYWIEPHEVAVEVDAVIKKTGILKKLRSENSGTEVYDCLPHEADMIVMGVCAIMQADRNNMKHVRTVNLVEVHG